MNKIIFIKFRNFLKIFRKNFWKNVDKWEEMWYNCDIEMLVKCKYVS